MATIKENGAPTKHTVGATGDFYDDLDTGKRYECESILTVSGGFQEYEWREVEQVINAEPVAEDIPDEETTEEVPVVEEKEPEQPVNNQQYGQNQNNNRNWNGNKTQYNKQYRSNNK